MSVLLPASQPHRVRSSAGRLPAAMLCMALLTSLLGTSVLAAKLPGEGQAAASSPVTRTGNEPSLGTFLDAAGQLQFPPGFSGSVNPAGYRIMSGEGEALRFAPEAANAGSTSEGWTGFRSVGKGCNGSVRAVAIGGMGDVYVGGHFTRCGETLARNVARFDMSTQTWEGLGSGEANGVNSAINALIISGNAVYVAGFFSQAGGTTANRVARFDTTSQTWRSLGSGAANGVNGFIHALAVAGNTVYVAGGFSQAGGAQANGVARFVTTNQTWASLGNNAANGVNNSVNAIAVSGSTVYVGGNFTQAGGAPANNIARFETITETWASLGSGAANGVEEHVFALAVAKSTLYVGGRFTQAGGKPANYVARFDTTTQKWASLGKDSANGMNSFVLALAVSGSTVYVGGPSFTQAGVVPANYVARFDTTTETWASLGNDSANGVNDSVDAIAVSGSTVYVGGVFSQAGGAPAKQVASFETTTETWASVGSGTANMVNRAVNSLAISGNSVYAGGGFSWAGDERANQVARFDTTTQTWASLGSGADNGIAGTIFASVHALAVSGGTVYVGGDFTQAGTTTANRVARFDTTTQTWASLGSDPANGVNGGVRALAVSGSALYVGGSFTQAGGAPANGVARFDTTTQTWASLGSDAANGVNGVGWVDALAVSGDTVYVGGLFTQAGGAPANYVARFDITTQTWASLGNDAADGVNDSVRAIAVFGSTVYVGGNFTQAGGAPANYVAQFDTTTQTWASLGSGAANGVQGGVSDLAVSGGTVYVGGNFTQAGGVPANYVARFGTTTQTWASLGNGVANGLNSLVFVLASSADGTLYVGGSFSNAGGQLSPNIARYRAEVIFRNGFE